MSAVPTPRRLRRLLGGVRFVQRGMRRLAACMNALAGWSYLGVAAFVTCDVVTRSVFGFSSGSTTQIAGYVLACGITWGLAQTFYERAHIRIDILVMRMPLRVRQYMHLIALVLLLVFDGFLVYSGYVLAAESARYGSTDLSALALPLAVPQFIWTAGLAVFALVLSVMLAEVVLLLLLGEAAQVDALLAHVEGEGRADAPVERGIHAS